MPDQTDNPEPAALEPTPEQQAVIDASERCQKVAAFAGTGKTTTLRAWSKAHPKERILYLAFNKAVQQEAAATFPQHVVAKTAHALAYQALGVGRRFGEKLGRRFPFKHYQQLLSLPIEGLLDKNAFQLWYCIRHTIGKLPARRCAIHLTTL